MSGKNTGIKITNIIISVFCILIALLEFISGADLDSRFYYIDNIAVRIIAVLIIVAAVGLLFRNLLARKAMIVLSIVSLLEIFITIKFNNYDPVFFQVLMMIIMVLIYSGPMIYLLVPKVKAYYINKEFLDNAEIDKDKPLIKNSSIGKASFILSMISVFSLISVGFFGYHSASNEGTIPTPDGIVPMLLVILAFLASSSGLGLGIAGLFLKNKKKTFAVWGTIFSALFVIMFIICVFAAVNLMGHSVLYPQTSL